MLFNKILQNNEIIVLDDSLIENDTPSINIEREIRCCHFSEETALYYYDNLIDSVWNITLTKIIELKYEEAFSILFEALELDFSENPINLKILISYFLLSTLAYKIQDTLNTPHEKLKYIDIGLEFLLKVYNNFGENIYFKKMNVIPLMVELVSLKKDIETVQKINPNQNLLSNIEMIIKNSSYDNTRYFKNNDFVEIFINIVEKYEQEKNAETSILKMALTKIREELRDSKYGLVCYCNPTEKEARPPVPRRKHFAKAWSEQTEIISNFIDKETRINELNKSSDTYAKVLARQLATNYILSIINNQKKNNTMINEVLVRYIEWQDFCPNDLELIGYFINILKSQELMTAINGKLIQEGLKNTIKNCSNATDFSVLLKLASVDFAKIALKIMYERYNDLAKAKILFNSNVVLDITYRIIRENMLIKEKFINGNEQQKEKIINSVVSALHEDIKKYITDDLGWGGLVRDLLQDKAYSNDSQSEKIKLVVNILNKIKEVTEEYNLIINGLLEKYIDIAGNPKESIYKKNEN